jgi:hypothetical protein
VPFSPPEGVEQAFTGRLQIDAYQALFCDPEFARLWFTTYAVTLPPSAPARRLPFEMEFTSWTRPTNHELASFRHEKIAWETMCVVRIDLQQPDRPSVRYYPAAVPRLVSAGIDYPPELDRINLAGRFPCAPEAEAAASWYNRPGVHRTKEDQMALEELFAGEQSGGPAQCLVGYKHLIARLDADDHAPLYVNPEATCDSELAIAASYDRVLTNYGPLHATIAAALASTRAAAARGDEGACRQAVADIRSTFIGAVYGTDRRD